MAASEQAEQNQFEEGVRQTARLLWVEAALDGSLELQGRERDGVFETRDTIHVVEATVSGKREKADSDAKKTAQTVQHIRGAGGKFAQGWFITRNEPTIEQKKAVDRYSHSVRCLSFDQFRSMLFNGSEYIRCRSNASFGSISDPYSGNIIVDRSSYVTVDMFRKLSTSPTSARDISTLLKQGYRAILVGDFGAGKSMTLREVFFLLSDTYINGLSAKTPVFINLRDHRGQTDPVEALERHARSIGYNGGASDLVRAWRSGNIDLILDGFDEIATSGWGQSLTKVREHRYAAMALVRNFSKQTPQKSGFIISGRMNFFDTSAEMSKALGTNEAWDQISLNDFTPNQVKSFLNKIGYEGEIPDWVPARPLIVAYFAMVGKASDLRGELSGLTAGAGWDKFLTMISERESTQDDRLDPETVRQIIERLATKARVTTDGMGRLSVDVVQSAYREVVGILPDEGGQQLLLRLPGLASSSYEDGTRSFVDGQFASAARAGDIIRFTVSPFNFDIDVFSETQSPLGSSAKDVFQHYKNNELISDGQIKAAFEMLRSRNHPNQLGMDMVACCLYCDDGNLIGSMSIKDAVEEEIQIRDSDNTGLHFTDCIISSVTLDDNANRNQLPTFSGCIIGTVEGLGSGEGLPKQISSSDVAMANSGTSTNSEIMTLTASEPVKVLLTVLKKLFMQSGSGRQLSAFSRGLDARAAKFVPDVLALIQRDAIAAPSRIGGKEIWIPNRSMSGRIRKILSAPLLSDDNLIKQAEEL